METKEKKEVILLKLADDNTHYGDLAIQVDLSFQTLDEVEHKIEHINDTLHTCIYNYDMDDFCNLVGRIEGVEVMHFKVQNIHF